MPGRIFIKTNAVWIAGLDDLAAAVPCCKDRFRQVHLPRAMQAGTVLCKMHPRGGKQYYANRDRFERYLAEHQRQFGFV